jgi:hypothetical protein
MVITEMGERGMGNAVKLANFLVSFESPSSWRFFSPAPRLEADLSIPGRPVRNHMYGDCGVLKCVAVVFGLYIPMYNAEGLQYPQFLIVGASMTLCYIP